MDLTAFLAARLDEEHLLAHKFIYVDGGEWTADELARLWWYSEPPKPRSATDPIIQHAARYNPARVLREVAAKRAILAEHQEAASGGYCELCYYGYGGGSWPCPTVRALASVYSDHPDYDPEWAVQP